MHIGLKIKELAVRKNLTLADMAKILGKTKQAIYEIVDKEDVNSAILKQLSSYFNIPISYFFGEDQETISIIQEKLAHTEQEVLRLKSENESLRAGRTSSTKVLIELDVTLDEFIKMGLHDKIVQVLDKK